MAEYKLRATGLNKHYGAIQALKDINITLQGGQTHAVVGSNGAGKSTLVKILTGAVMPDSGSIEIDGRPVILGVPRAALDAGIACIYQHPNLVPELSVADNIVLGHHPTRAFGFLDRKAQRKAVVELLEKHNLKLDPNATTGMLSSVQQKEVEIAKALSRDASVILMDEPTAALSYQEVEKLFHSIEQLCAKGIAVLYISHMLDEIFRIAKQVTVLRDGQVRLSAPTETLSKNKLVDAMLGRELISAVEAIGTHEEHNKTVALECVRLNKHNVFHDISFKAHAGEILCITGLIGSKRTELVRAIFGADPADSGEIRVWGKTAHIRHPLDAIRLGIGFVAEDRHRDGLFLDLSIAVNTVTAALNRFTRRGILLPRAMQVQVKRQIEKLEIHPPIASYPVKNLSGGNQQKVQLSRWMLGNTRILILDEPTIGIDVGTKATLYRLFRDLAMKDTAIVVVSSDIEEVLTIADRILVMANGRIVETFLRNNVTEQQILFAASGEAV